VPTPEAVRITIDERRFSDAAGGASPIRIVFGAIYARNLNKAIPNLRRELRPSTS
jgi:hypothetical protein